MKKFALMLCLIFIFAMSFFAFNLNFVSADSEIIEINKENISEILNEFDVNGNYKLTQDVEVSGTNFIINNFSGTFDGNGKTITIDLSLTGGNAGLFGKLTNATVKNLCVVVNVDACQRDQNGIVYENGIIVSSITSDLNFGGIAGEVVGSEINSCKTTVNFYNENLNKERVAIESEYSLNFGGVAGKSEGSSIQNTYSLSNVMFAQKGNQNNESNFGGIVGKINNGSIENCYSAPTQEIVKNLTGVVSEKPNFDITNLNPNAIVSFGGIVGFAEGLNLKITNVLSINYLLEDNLYFGGIIGRLNGGSLYMPKSVNIKYCKYLTVNSSTLAVFNKMVGNNDDVSFVAHTSNVSIDSFPTNVEYFANGTWDSVVSWNFDDVWKRKTIYDAVGIFLPDLQIFSMLTINLQFGTYANFYELYFAEDENLETKTTSKVFPIGAVVNLEAKLISSTDDEQKVIPSQFYEFVSWQKVEDPEFSRPVEIENGVAKYQFVCSSSTAGSYYLSIKGKPVEVYIHLKADDDKESDFGKINYLNQEKTADFSFTMTYADDSDVKSISAVEVGEEYKFLNFQDSINNPNFHTTSKSLQFKLNNLNSSSPKVYPDEDENKLKCDIYAVFSNNTTDVVVSLTKDAGKIVINGEEITSKKTITLIANKEYDIKIIGNEGFELNKIELNNSEIEINNKIKFSKTENNLKITFSEVENKSTAVNIWIIIIPIVSVIAVGGIITLIILTIKKKNENSYKKNFRY